jgi:hypothetical protein
MGNYEQKVSEPEPRGERVAAYVEHYLNSHKGLSLGELAFRLKADKRDMQRLIRDRSCGWKLEDRIAAYFGDDFIDHAIRRPLLGDGPSIRELELDNERADIARRNLDLERARAARRSAGLRSSAGLRMVPEPGL